MMQIYEAVIVFRTLLFTLLSIMANGPMVRMNELDKVEKEVVNCLGSAGKALEEIGKDKPSQKQVDNLVSQFMTSLQVEIKYS